MHARHDADLSVERADVRETATVDADLVAQHPLPDQLLGQRTEGRPDLLLTTLVRRADLGKHRRLQFVEPILAVVLAGDRERLGEVLGNVGLDGFEHVVLVVEEAREFDNLLGRLLGETALCLAHLPDERLGRLESLGDDLLGRCLLTRADPLPRRLRRLGLDHHDRDIAALGDAAGHDHVEDGLLDLAVRGEADPLAVDQRHPGGTDGAAERQPGELGGHRRRIDREDVVRRVGVQGQHRNDDLHLVAEARHEGRTQWPVDQPAGQDRVLRRPSLATEERAGDPAGGVHPLLHVDGEREEVELVLRVLTDRRGRQQHGFFVEIGDGRPGRLLGKLSGLEPDGALAESSVVDNRLDGRRFGTRHGCPFVLVTPR